MCVALLECPGTEFHELYIIRSSTTYGQSQPPEACPGWLQVGAVSSAMNAERARVDQSIPRGRVTNACILGLGGYRFVCRCPTHPGNGPLPSVSGPRSAYCTWSGLAPTISFFECNHIKAMRKQVTPASLILTLAPPPHPPWILALAVQTCRDWLFPLPGRLASSYVTHPCLTIGSYISSASPCV